MKKQPKIRLFSLSTTVFGGCHGIFLIHIYSANFKPTSNNYRFQVTLCGIMFIFSVDTSGKCLEQFWIMNEKFDFFPMQEICNGHWTVRYQLLPLYNCHLLRLHTIVHGSLRLNYCQDFPRCPQSSSTTLRQSHLGCPTRQQSWESGLLCIA